MSQIIDKLNNLENLSNEQIADDFISLVTNSTPSKYSKKVFTLQYKLSSNTSYNQNENYELLKMCSEKLSQCDLKKLSICHTTPRIIYISQFFTYLVQCNNATKLIYDNLYLIKYVYEYNKNILISKSKFKNFLIIYKFLQNNYINDDIKFSNNYILSQAARNYDDRVFKYCVKNISFTPDYSFFRNLLSRPQKYFIKRLKYLQNNNLISNNDIKHDLFNAIYDSSHIDNINLSTVFFKYYYDFTLSEKDINILTENIFCINNSNNTDNFNTYKTIMNYLKTKTEKHQFNLYCLGRDNIIIDIKYLDFDKINKTKFFCLYSRLQDYYDFYNNDSSKIFDIIIKKAIQSKHFQEFLLSINKNITDSSTRKTLKNQMKSVYGTSNSDKKLFMLPYIKETRDIYNPRINYLYIKLKLFIKKIRLNKNIKRNIQFNPVLFELIRFHSNKSMKVLKNNEIKLNTVPPHLMLPGEIELLNNFIIKEKADGELVYKLPNNINPPFNMKYDIKAEYIEELDLYLVFDINIDMNIIDKYNFLRNKHYATSGRTIENVNSMNELIELINHEREIFINFINEDYDEFRWYPKAAWNIITLDKKFINDIYDFINEESIYNTIILNNDYYENDGFIITQSDSDEEIKIKPRSLMTIDLEYDGINFLDRDNNKYSIKTSDNFQSKKGIYRCYPIENDYIAKELRFDKKKPNPYNVVNNIINLSKIKYSIKEHIYYHDVNYKNNKSWKKVVSDNLKNLINVNNFMYKNNNILDLGCGKSKVLKLKIDYTQYTGYDYDVYILLRNMKNMKSRTNNDIKFNYIDLSGDWNDTKDKFYDIKYNTYMNIYAVNSLMHFNTPLFWKQINKVSKVGTRFLFNVLRSNISKEIYWVDNNSYIKQNESIVELYFENVHSKPIIEKYITIKDVIDYLKKYSFKIIYKYVSDNNNITDLYEWYVCEKK